jgi:hypothetical protein
VGRGKPPKGSYFPKGKSGNPGGRPKGSGKAPVRTPFDVLFEITTTIEQNGRSREVTAEEALEQKLLQMAFEGKATAIRKILKMIEKREAARRALAPPGNRVRVSYATHDPDNANAALVLLEIAENTNNHDCERLNLHAWAVQAALDRWRRKLPSKDLSLVKSNTLNPELVRWPDGRDE